MADLSSTEFSEISLPTDKEKKNVTKTNFKKQTYSNFGLRYKILEFFQNSQPIIVCLLCILMAIVVPLGGLHVFQFSLVGCWIRRFV